MKYRHLGKAGIQVSELSFGSWVTFHTGLNIWGMPQQQFLCSITGSPEDLSHMYIRMVTG